MSTRLSQFISQKTSSTFYIFFAMLVLLIIIPSTGISQYSLYLKDGSIISGMVDGESMKDTSIRFKEIRTKQWRWYHIDLVNFIRLPDGKLWFPDTKPSHSTEPVIGNTKSIQYHLSNVKHLPDSLYQMHFESPKVAEDKGYSSCPACFNLTPKLLDYYLEKFISRQSYIEFRNNNEILYEHPQLEYIQKTANKILSKWPFSTKGYQYRIEIYRDEAPNAVALAGGHLFVSDGMLSMIEDEKELEAVLAHEIGHVERRHTLRSFYEHQKKKTLSGILAFVGGVATAMLGGNTNEVSMVMQLTSSLSDLVFQIQLSGYSRELEQEADIMAQLYLNFTDASNLYLVSIFDKLATYRKTRSSIYQKSLTSNSTHPSIIDRTLQVENSSFYEYPDPLIFSVYSSQKVLNLSGNLKYEISHFYIVKSSTNDSKVLLFFLGKLFNEHKNWGFKINSLSIKFLDTNRIREIKGLSDRIIIPNSMIEFIGSIEIDKYKVNKIYEQLISKSFIPGAVIISPILIDEQGSNTKIPGLNNVSCLYTIK